MAQSSMVGSRIRERRVLSGIKQTDLAMRAGISASYLNLIEHNRRKIGGKTLLQLAEALEVEPSWLSEGAEAALIAGLREVAGAQPGHNAEQDRAEEFAGRFPGWAGLLVQTANKLEVMEETVQTLTDRLAHDPHLAASLHELISTVTSIRSTASILADTKELEPEWRARFDRNINEDSSRLAEGAEALVRYLEDAPDTDAEIQSPQDELHAFLAAHDYHFPELEETTDAALGEILQASKALASDSARQLARAWLEQYQRDAQALPLAELRTAIERYDMKPDRMLAGLEVSGGCLFRRLATMPSEIVGPVGLVTCDGSGTVLMRKELPGFAMPRAAGACPLWPLYEVLLQPNKALSAILVQSSRAQDRIQSYTLAETLVPARFDLAAQIQVFMLLLPAGQAAGGAAARQVGSSCRICPREGCAARREPSIVAKGF